MQLRHLVAQGAHIGLHSQRRLRPIVRRKGKWPEGVGGVRQWFHTSPAGIPQGQTAGRFIAEICDWVQRKMFEERDTERHDLRLPGDAILCSRTFYLVPSLRASTA